ncbi:hypothetical protein CLOP_g1677 [Closterium sp. NIES-67]|nr:hypothetical protein CLOP_g1677 [Closterium sp. NIES-67]
MLQKLVKDGSLKGLEVKGEVKEIGSCPTCLETKFSKFPFNSTTGPAKTPLALEKRGKLEASGRWGVHLGIAKDHKGWLLWDLTTQKLTVSRDVKFLESLYYKEWKQQQQKLPSTPLIVEADEVQRPSRQVEVAVSEEEMSGVTEEGGAAEVEQQQQQHESPPRQTKGKDYDEVFAPVGKGTTLRVLLAIAALLGWKIRHMDIVTAFLNGIIMEEVYMKLAGMSVH